MRSFSVLAAIALGASLAQAGTASFDPNNLPYQTEKGQYGFNDCYKRTGGKDSPTSKCQSAWISSVDDFCLFAPKSKQTVGNAERDVVAWCTKPGHGARLIPKGALTGVHFIRTPHYIQISGVGDLTKMNVPNGDEGGELDPHGADGLGNPIGGIVFGTDNNGKKVQFIEWMSFIAYNEWSIRACFNGPDAYKWCQHTYDVMGSQWVHPGKYTRGFDSCKARDTVQPPGIYSKNGKLSTFHQGDKTTPAAHPAAPSSQCVAVKSVAGYSYK